MKNALSHAYQAGVNASSENPRLIQKQLTSNAMFHTPGLFRALQNDYRIKVSLACTPSKPSAMDTDYRVRKRRIAERSHQERDRRSGWHRHFTSRCEESPTGSDPVQKPYSVLLLYPDYADDTGYETYYALVEAADPNEAVAVAQRQAVAAQDGIEIEPDDFHPLLVTPGHHDSEPLFNK